MSKRYSGKSFKDSSVMKKAKLSLKEKRKIKKDKKKNKLPADVHSIDFELEYGKATIEVHKDSISQNDSVLIIDDLIATGGTAEAAAKLIEVSEGNVAAFIFVINLFDLGGCDNLLKKGYNVENLMDFPGH